MLYFGDGLESASYAAEPNDPEFVKAEVVETSEATVIETSEAIVVETVQQIPVITELNQQPRPQGCCIIC